MMMMMENKSVWNTWRDSFSFENSDYLFVHLIVRKWFVCVIFESKIIGQFLFFVMSETIILKNREEFLRILICFFFFRSISLTHGVDFRKKLREMQEEIASKTPFGNGTLISIKCLQRSINDFIRCLNRTKIFRSIVRFVSLTAAWRQKMIKTRAKPNWMNFIDEQLPENMNVRIVNVRRRLPMWVVCAFD